jgi:outer membrane cobalamin receptor
VGIAIFCLAGLGQHLCAEEIDQKSPVTMDEVVVTATKTEEQRKDVPNSVIVVDDIDIDASPATSLGDLLGGELGVDWRTRGNYGGAAQEIHIRGMDGDGVQVLVNGITLNSPSLGVADAGKIPLNAIDRIEVVKGSGSVLYGSGAMGGTVNITTKNPQRDGAEAQISAGAGTEASYGISARQGMYVTDTVGYYITASHYQTDGFRDNSDLDQNDASAKLVFDRGEKLWVSLYADFIDRENGRPGPQPPASKVDSTTNLYSNESANLLNKTEEQDKHLVLTLKSRPLAWLELRLQTDYAHLKSENNNRYYSAYTPGNLPGSTTEVINEVYGVEGNVELTPFSGATLLAGAQFKDYNWENTKVTLDGFGNESSPDPTDADVFSTGVFAQGQYRPNQYIKAVVGVRHEEHSEFGTEMLPRYGIVVNPLENTAIKANTGRHFKAPTPNDLFWPKEDWGFLTGAEGNPDLEPEIGWHTDAVIEHSFAKVFFSLGYFQWDIDGKIEWAPDANFFYRPENLSHYEASGWEVGTKIGPIANMTLSLDYTHTDAEEQKSGGVARQARYTASNFFKTGLTYWFDFGLDVTATIRYTDERPAIYTDDTDSVPAAELDAYWTVDLKANQILFDHWKLSLQVNNLLDEAYDTYVETFYDESGNGTLSNYPGAGRSLFVQLAYQY